MVPASPVLHLSWALPALLVHGKAVRCGGKEQGSESETRSQEVSWTHHPLWCRGAAAAAVTLFSHPQV